MPLIKRIDFYFDRFGSENTLYVIEAVKDRVKELGLKWVVVASTSGATGLRFVESLRGLADTIVISYKSMDRVFAEKIQELGGFIVENCSTPLSNPRFKQARDTLYLMGQGFKVAVEVVLIATDLGLLEIGTDVVGVGGTEKGADTAIVMRAAPSNSLVRGPGERRPVIREIIAMPRVKMWWF